MTNPCDRRLSFGTSPSCGDRFHGCPSPTFRWMPAPPRWYVFGWSVFDFVVVVLSLPFEQDDDDVHIYYVFSLVSSSRWLSLSLSLF